MPSGSYRGQYSLEQIQKREKEERRERMEMLISGDLYDSPIDIDTNVQQRFQQIFESDIDPRAGVFEPVELPGYEPDTTVRELPEVTPAESPLMPTSQEEPLVDIDELRFALLDRLPDFAEEYFTRDVEQLQEAGRVGHTRRKPYIISDSFEVLSQGLFESTYVLQLLRDGIDISEPTEEAEEIEEAEVESPTTGYQHLDTGLSLVGTIGGVVTDFATAGKLLGPIFSVAGMADLPFSAGLRFGSKRLARTGMEHLATDEDIQMEDYLQRGLGGLVGGQAGHMITKGIQTLPGIFPEHGAWTQAAYPIVERGLAGAGVGAGFTYVDYIFKPEDTSLADLGTNMASMAALYSLPLLDKSNREDVRKAVDGLYKPIDPKVKKEAYMSLGVKEPATDKDIKEAWARRKREILNRDFETDDPLKINKMRKEQLADIKEAREVAYDVIDETPWTTNVKNIIKQKIDEFSTGIARKTTGTRPMDNLPVEQPQTVETLEPVESFIEDLKADYKAAPEEQEITPDEATELLAKKPEKTTKELAEPGSPAERAEPVVEVPEEVPEIPEEIAEVPEPGEMVEVPEEPITEVPEEPVEAAPEEVDVEPVPEELEEIKAPAEEVVERPYKDQPMAQLHQEYEELQEKIELQDIREKQAVEKDKMDEALKAEQEKHETREQQKEITREIAQRRGEEISDITEMPAEEEARIMREEEAKADGVADTKDTHPEIKEETEKAEIDLDSPEEYVADTYHDAGDVPVEATKDLEMKWSVYSDKSSEFEQLIREAEEQGLDINRGDYQLPDFGDGLDDLAKTFRSSIDELKSDIDKKTKVDAVEKVEELAQTRKMELEGKSRPYLRDEIEYELHKLRTGEITESEFWDKIDIKDTPVRNMYGSPDLRTKLMLDMVEGLQKPQADTIVAEHRHGKMEIKNDPQLVAELMYELGAVDESRPLKEELESRIDEQPDELSPEARQVLDTYMQDYADKSLLSRTDIEAMHAQPQKLIQRTDAGRDMTETERAELPVEVRNDMLARRVGVDEFREEYLSRLYEAYDQLGVQATYEQLEEGILGHYRPEKAEMGVYDISDIESMLHEFGHVIDYRLTEGQQGLGIAGRFGEEFLEETFYNQLSPGEQAMYRDQWLSQLANISKHYIRPIDTHAFFGSDYRQNIQELMADFYSLYLSNPNLAHEKAPDVTRGIEKRLNEPENEGVRNIVHEVMSSITEGEPTADFPYPITSTAEIETNWNPLEGDSNATLGDKAQAVTESRTKYERIKKFEMTLNVQKLTENLSEFELNLIPFYIEGTGNVQWVELVEQDPDNFEVDLEELEYMSAEEIQEYFDNLPNSKKVWVDKVSLWYEQARQSLNKTLQSAGSDVQINFIKNYMSRLYQNDEDRIENWWKTKPPSAEARKYPTLVEAIEDGMIPKTTNAASLLLSYTEQNVPAVANVKFLSHLENLTDQYGNPVVQDAEGAHEIMTEHPDIEFVSSDHPAFRRFYGKTDDKGNTVLYERPGYVNKEVWQYANYHLGELGDFLGGDYMTAIHDINALMKSFNYFASLFHWFDIGAESAMGMFKISPTLKDKEGNDFFDSYWGKNQGLELKASKDFMRTALWAGVNVNPHEEAFVGKLHDFLGKMADKTSDIPGVSTGFKGLQKLQEAQSSYLWGHLYTGNKLINFHRMLTDHQDKFLPDDPTPLEWDRLKYTAAEITNNAFGGINWEKYGDMFLTSPNAQRFMHLIVRAPNWTLSNINMGKNIFLPYAYDMADKFSEDELGRWEEMNRGQWKTESRSYWIKMIIGLGLLGNAMQFALNGNFMWNNEPGRKTDINVTRTVHAVQKMLGRYDEDDQRDFYASPGKQLKEVARFFGDEAFNQMGWKLSPVSQLAVEQITRHSAGSGFPKKYADHDLSLGGELLYRMRDVAEQFTPFSLSGNNFALTFPMRRGVSKYGLTKQYENLVKSMIDPSFRERLFGTPETPQNAGQAIEMWNRVGAEQGHDTVKARTWARSNLRGEYYDMLWEGVENQDAEQVDRAAIALLSLGADKGLITQSGRHRDMPRESIRAALQRIDRDLYENRVPIPRNFLDPR